MLLPQSLAAADARVIADGLPPLALMDRAADAVVRVVRGRYARRPVSVVCGPGQNGGDGWAVAHKLALLGWDVALHAAVGPDRLEGAARQAADRYGGAALGLSGLDVSEGRLILDALFGAGLARDLTGGALAAVRAMDGGAAPILAIDLPSGVDGATGRVRGHAARADATVTFHRPKPGHLLQPGGALTGRLFVADIGLADDAEPDARRAHARLFPLPRPGPATHKYARGSVVVASGGHARAGAARLAANAAARAGAGAVTLASPTSALDVNARACDAVMVTRMGEGAGLARMVAERGGAAVLGPGMGRSGGRTGGQMEATRDRVQSVLSMGTPTVLDADALTVFEDDPDTLFALTHGACVLTPHEGEFARLFGESDAPSKLDRARAAADRAGCTVLLKGADTVIASPGTGSGASPGAVPVICDHGPPWLATAGSGDALAGTIGALLAQGMDAHRGAAMGAWLHAEAGRLGGPSVTADDLARLIGQARAAVLSAQSVGA